MPKRQEVQEMLSPGLPQQNIKTIAYSEDLALEIGNESQQSQAAV
jgi:hypothetical protein